METNTPSKKPAIAIIVLLAAVITVAMIAYGILGNDASGRMVNADTETGTPASNGEPTLADLDSVVFDEMENAYRLSDIANNKPLVVNFWATWCPYCIDEMADFQKLYDIYGSSISFCLLDAVDGTRETVDSGSSYLYENEFTLPAYYDTRSNAVSDFGVTAFPTTVVFAADGSVLYAQAGRINTADMQALLDELG